MPSAFRIAAVAVPVLLAPSLLLAQRDYTVTRTASVAAGGAGGVEIANGSGRLVVRGVQGASEVRATGVVHAESQRDLDQIQLIARREGNTIVVRPETGDGWFRGCDCSMDLTVEIPAGMSAEVTDGSGGAEVSNVGALAVHSGSGGARIEHVNGDLEVTSGSGGVRASDVHGDVRTTSGSGGIQLQQITGSVEVPHAGSGSVTLTDIKGSVHVGSVGSGGVHASGVGGDLTVDHVGSGGVTYASVKGKVSVPERRRWY